MKAQKNKIAPISVFFLLYVSRIIVTLTYVQAVTTSVLKSDILISTAIAMGITILICLPVLYCYKTHKNPIDTGWVGAFYALYLIFVAGVNISRFSYFASTTLNPDSNSALFVLIIGACAVYASLLGIEGISRFSSFCFALLIVAITSVFICNARNYDEVSLYPIISNKTDTIFYNALILASNSAEIVLFLPLSKRVNGYAVKPFIWSITASFLTIFLIMLFIFGVMGDSASLHSFPLYTLFQLAKIGSFERIDALHISFWIFGIFLKSAVLIYCASVCIKRLEQKTKCIVCGIGAVITALLITNVFNVNTLKPYMQAIPFAVFAVIIPVLTLIFKKRNRGDELIEKF
ncbi:MAG: GerAB/ArcD/ProY family transporter [Eubacterium sp.]